ncbi:MAG TPA: exodeoxyribonuclease VII large subunit [Pseudomonadales bacterium]|nr:exodeoxyribonuclease VII large subunit [Pseudomonadales bacterium]
MTASENILSVAELNRRARQLLEVHLATVWVRGEISNLSMPSSGHWYFTLKDDKAQIKCAMFRGNNALLRFKPEHGMQIIARGRVSLYEGRGDYQLIAENLQIDGAGSLQIAFEQLKAKLENERLFDEDFKQELPTLPKHIGVITSPTGAAIRDILSVFQRRFPAIKISIFPVPVQGVDAAPAIVKALQLANTQIDIDALILARGGGSLEDLWAFNEEAVARAVFASDIPVVSAVGHETDFTICDFVADIRAPTPSAAAELLSPDSSDYEALLEHYAVELQKQLQRMIATYRNELINLVKRLRHPGHALREQQQKLDHLEWRLLRAQRLHQKNLQLQLEKLDSQLQRQHPQQTLQQLHFRLDRAQQRLLERSRNHLQQTRLRLTHLMALLDSVSPLNTLKRGYAIATDASGKNLTRATHTHKDARVVIQLFEGQLDCRVEHLTPETLPHI